MKRATAILAAALLVAAGAAAPATLDVSATTAPTAPTLMTVVPGDPWLFTPTGQMAYGRDGHAAALLLDGRVLVTGGRGWRGTGTSGMYGNNLTAELYDPASGRFQATGDMAAPRRGHSSTLLDDGRVLVVGGAGGTPVGTPLAELFDPTTGRFTRTADPRTGRSDHAAVKLLDGSVVIIGGSADATFATRIEIFDPATATFRLGASDPLLRRVHPSAVLLPDGRVLVAGGDDIPGADPVGVLGHAAIWDPTTDAVLDLGPLPGSGRVAGMSTLPDGRVLVVLLDRVRSRWTAHRFDPASQEFTLLADLPGIPWLDPVVLGDGRALLGLRTEADHCHGIRAMVFDPETGTTQDVGGIAYLGTCMVASLDPTLTRLADGSILIAGGRDMGGETVSKAVVFGPADVTR